MRFAQAHTSRLAVQELAYPQSKERTDAEETEASSTEGEQAGVGNGISLPPVRLPFSGFRVKKRLRSLRGTKSFSHGRYQ